MDLLSSWSLSPQESLEEMKKFYFLFFIIAFLVWHLVFWRSSSSSVSVVVDPNPAPPWTALQKPKPFNIPSKFDPVPVESYPTVTYLDEDEPREEEASGAPTSEGDPFDELLNPELNPGVNQSCWVGEPSSLPYPVLLAANCSVTPLTRCSSLVVHLCPDKYVHADLSSSRSCPWLQHWSCQSPDLLYLLSVANVEEEYFFLLPDSVQFCPGIVQYIEANLVNKPNLISLGCGGFLVKTSFVPRLEELLRLNTIRTVEIFLQENCRVPEDRCVWTHDSWLQSDRIQCQEPIRSVFEREFNKTEIGVGKIRLGLRGASLEAVRTPGAFETTHLYTVSEKGEEFRIIPHDKEVFFRGESGHYVTLDPMDELTGSADHHGICQQISPESLSDALWLLKPVEGKPNRFYVTQGRRLGYFVHKELPGEAYVLAIRSDAEHNHTYKFFNNLEEAEAAYWEKATLKIERVLVDIARGQVLATLSHNGLAVGTRNEVLICQAFAEGLKWQAQPVPHCLYQKWTPIRFGLEPEEAQEEGQEWLPLLLETDAPVPFEKPSPFLALVPGND